jgi:protein-disulfide isomerase
MLNLRVGLVLALSLLAAACSKGGTSSALPDDMAMGPDTAKVTVAEYASVGCPICARWYEDVWPTFKSKYIDTGRVKFVSKEMLVGAGAEVAVAANGFLLARCAGKDKYFAVTDAIYKSQAEAFNDPRGVLLAIAKSVGMPEDQFNKCVEDKAAIQALNDRVERHNRKDGVDSTPTFIVNGQKLEPGYHPIEDLDAAIVAAEKAVK